MDGRTIIFLTIISSTVSASLHGNAGDSNLANRMAELDQEVANLKKTVQQQNDLISTLLAAYGEQERKLSGFQDDVSALQEYIKANDVDRKAPGQSTGDDANSPERSENTHANSTMPTEDAEVGADTSTETTKDDVRSRRFVADPEGPLAFHALIKPVDITHLNPAQSIPFADVRLNLGGGYHEQHGLIIAPVDGIYSFSLSIASVTEARVGIFKNGAVSANAYSNGGNHLNQGSTTAVMQLNQGDEVYPHLHGPNDATIHGNGYSTFSGNLIVRL